MKMRSAMIAKITRIVINTGELLSRRVLLWNSGGKDLA
jgi:hypothetical protein